MYSTERCNPLPHSRLVAEPVVGAITVGAGLDAGHVELFVDQAERVLATAQSDGRCPPDGSESVEVEELREPHDRVQGSAQVVTHARQEFVLGEVGAIGLVAGPFQVLVRGHEVAGALDDARFELHVEVPKRGFGRGEAAALLRLAQRAGDGRAELVEPILEDVVGRPALQAFDGSRCFNRPDTNTNGTSGQRSCARLWASSPPNPGLNRRRGSGRARVSRARSTRRGTQPR